MPPKPKTQADYEKLADSLGLDLIDPVPLKVITSVHWRCIYCGRIHKRSYNKCMFAEFGCRCQSQKNLKESDYRTLASRLGIKWIARSIPLTAHDSTTWESFKGQIFTAPYAKLAYPLQVPTRLLSHLAHSAREKIEEAQAERRERLRGRRPR